MQLWAEESVRRKTSKGVSQIIEGESDVRKPRKEFSEIFILPRKDLSPFLCRMISFSELAKGVIGTFLKVRQPV